MQSEPKVNILLVDDQKLNLLALSELLNSLGHNLVMADSGKEALKCLLEQEFAVIIMDVQMPEMDGFETARIIRQRPSLQDTPIIFITAIDRDSLYILQGYALGAVDYLLKPIIPEILISKVSVFISLFQKSQQVKQQAAQLAAANQELRSQIAQRQQAESALQKAKAQLEIKVQQRTEELVKTNELLQAILDNSPALIYLKDLQGRYILINRQYELSCHLSKEQVIGKTDRDIFPEEIAEQLQLNDQKVLDYSQALEFEEVIAVNDSLSTYIALKFPLYQANEIPYAVGGIATNITQRIQAEEALRVIAERFRTALKNSAIIVFNQDTDLRYTWIYNCIAPLAAKDFIGQLDAEIFAHDDAERLTAIKRQVLTTGRGTRQETWITWNDQINYYDLTVEPLFNSAGEIVGITCAAIDITEQKKAEETRHALAAEQELRKIQLRFFSQASHELRTPLSTILGSIQLLKMYAHTWSEEDRIRNINRLETTAKFLTQLLDDILTINRSESGKLKFNPQPVNLEKFCRNFVADVQITAGDNYQINLIIQGPNKTAKLDEKMLRNILDNLLSNALKYSPQGGCINLKLNCTNSAVIFQIQDSGIGISPDDQNHLFELFYRGKNVANIPGTGLGLTVIKKYLDLQGGKISIHSEPGIGTTVTVTIPVSYK